MIWRASALGGCLRGLVAEQLGEKPILPDDDSLTRMGEGALHEEDVIARLEADDWVVTRRQEEVLLVQQPLLGVRYKVQGHLDGVIYPINENQTPWKPRVLEVKSMSRDAYREFDQKGWYGDWLDGSLVDRYRWQLSVYMHATGLEALLVTKDRNSGQIAQHGIETPYYTLEQITARVAFLEDHVARRALPATCPHNWFCPFKWMCAREEEPGIGVGDDERLPVPDAVRLYVELGRQIASLEAEREEWKALLPALLGDATSVQWDGYRATRVVQDRKERVVPASRVEFIKVTKEKD